MELVGFFISCLLSIHIASAFDGRLLKHLSEPRPGGILDILKKPKTPLVNIHLSKGGGGFGAGASIGSFGFGFGFGGNYVPPGNGANLPPKEPPVPDVQPHVPDLKPSVPDLTPHVPELKPHLPGVTWEKEKGEKGFPRPNSEEYGEDEPNRKGEVEHPKHDSHDESKEDTRPAWEDIGEIGQDDPDSKSENFMDGDFIKEGLIQPRLNKKRSRRFIESHVYHVPLLFRSNAKPFQVKIQSNPNSFVKGGIEK